MQAILKASSGSDEALVRDLGLLMRALLDRSNRSVFQAFDELDMSFTQTKMFMSFTGRDDPRSIKALGDELGISLPAASRAIDGLLKRGFVTRTEDPQDRRSKLIALTTEGRAITERLLEMRISGINDFVATLEPDERSKLAAALEPVMAPHHPPAPRKDPSHA